jgi:tetratricopeptide (TPR) repeat protein
MKARSTFLLSCILLLAVGLQAQTASAPSKRLAWELGSALSLAGVVHAESADTALIGRQFGRASAAATKLGIKLPALPPKKGNRVEDSAAALAYLLGTTGNPIGAMLQRDVGPEHAAVFEIALKSNILLMLYGPGVSESKTIADVIRKRQFIARLPEVMTRQLLSLVDRGASYEEVKKELFSLHQLAPPFIQVSEYSDNGERLYGQKDYAGSAAEFTKALAMDPDGPEYYFSRARAYMQLGRNNEAVADYSKVIQLQGSSTTVARNLPLVYHNRGLAYSLLAKNALAMDDLTMAIKLRPEYASAYKVRGLLFRKMGNISRANADLAEAERLQPGITK